MRVSKVVLLVGVLMATSVASPALAIRHERSHAVITAKAAILIDNQTGQVLWQRNPDLPLPPASTTKIVTAMVALQSGRLEDSLSVTPDAAQAPPSKISLRAGWKMRLRDLVYALLLNSANDAAVVIAEGLSGDVRDFAERMNAEARALGATNTHFVNPNGLPAANHYSTARDLATMFGHGMQNPLFERIVSTKTASVWPVVGSRRAIALHNHNRLLGNYHIQVVGKTGWTLAAKKCFVGAATADGRELVVAVLGSRNLWRDLKVLIEFGFRGTDPPVAEAGEVEAATVPSIQSAGGDNDADDVSNARQVHKYAVRLATFRHLKGAAGLRESLSRSGYPVHIEKIRRGRVSFYRVSVGSYPSRRAAEQAAGQLKQTHRRLAGIVVSS